MNRLFAGTPLDIPPRCDACGELESDCQCTAERGSPSGGDDPSWIDPAKQTARVRVDRRKHKRLMTVVWGLKPDETDLPDLLAQLKSACGTGGSLQGDQLEIQGDHQPRVIKILHDIGYKVR